MATIINRSQQVATAGLSPRAAYSRVVSCVEIINAGAGPVYAVTSKVANNVWLHRVSAWGRPKTPNDANYTEFRVYAGSQEVNSAAEIERWENVLPLRWGETMNATWKMRDGNRIFTWDMDMFFKGLGRRFGFWAQRVGAGLDSLYMSFQISEG